MKTAELDKNIATSIVITIKTKIEISNLADMKSKKSDVPNLDVVTKKLIGCYVKPSLYGDVRNAANDYGVSISDFIREAVQLHLLEITQQ